MLNDDHPARKGVGLRMAHLIGVDHLDREVADFDNTTRSGHATNLPDMDGMLFIPEKANTLSKGALVEFQPFSTQR